MKLFKGDEVQPIREWGISVRQSGDAVQINAVDIITGEFVAQLLLFTPEKGLISRDRAGERLNEGGYDTHQNGNAFNSDTGNIWVRNEGELE